MEEKYGEADQANKNDRKAVDLVLYPPVAEDDVDSVGDSASDDEVEPCEVLSKLSSKLLNTDAELHDKAVDSPEEEDFFEGWTLAEVQKASTKNNLEPVRRKSRQVPIPAGGNVDPHDSENDQLFAKPSQIKKKKQDERKKEKQRKKTVKEAKKNHKQPAKPAKSNITGTRKRKLNQGLCPDLLTKDSSIKPHQSDSKYESAKGSAKPKLVENPFFNSDASSDSEEEDDAAAIPAGGNVEAEATAAIPAGGNVEGSPSRRRDNANEEVEEEENHKLPAKTKSQHINKTRKRKSSILAGGNVEAAATIPAGGNVEAGPSRRRDNANEEVAEKENHKQPAKSNIARTKKRKAAILVGGNVEAEAAQEEEEEVEEEGSEPVKRNKRSNRSKEYDRIWTSDDSKVGTKVGSFHQPENSYNSDEVQSCRRPYEFFRLFTNEDYLSEIIHQSRLYAHQNGKSRRAGEINLDSLLCLQAVMLLSGYNKVPNRRMYWQDQPDTRCPIVYDNIRRDTLDHVISILHFVDNNEESNDRSVLL